MCLAMLFSMKIIFLSLFLLLVHILPLPHLTLLLGLVLFCIFILVRVPLFWAPFLFPHTHLIQLQIHHQSIYLHTQSIYHLFWALLLSQTLLQTFLPNPSPHTPLPEPTTHTTTAPTLLPNPSPQPHLPEPTTHTTFALLPNPSPQLHLLEPTPHPTIPSSPIATNAAPAISAKPSYYQPQTLISPPIP
jgi:hypothetical protein